MIVRNGLVVSAIRDIRIEQGWTVKNGISLAGSPDAFPPESIHTHFSEHERTVISRVKRIIVLQPATVSPYLKKHTYRNLNGTEGAVNER